MAITFSKSISTTEFLNAYNNNIVEFSSDNILDSVKCDIVIGGYTFTITPINNLFRFNFKEVVKTLINLNNFKDDVTPSLDLTIDDSLQMMFLVDYTITFTDESTEDTNETYSFLKSVEQIANVSSRLLSEQQILNKPLLTMFNGYPVDLGRYSNGNFTIYNVNNGNQKAITSTATDTERLWFSEGNYDLSESDEQKTFEDRVLALTDGTLYENSCYSFDENRLLDIGRNSLYLIDSSTQKQVSIKLIDDCGVYLKWFNEYGSWSYWLFSSIFVDSINAKTIDVFNVDFESIDETYTTSLITGKEAKNQINLRYKNLEDYEVEQLKSILTSPRVELYNGNKGDAVTSSSWQTVKVVDGTFAVNNTKNNLTNLAITIDKNQYTQI